MQLNAAKLTTKWGTLAAFMSAVSAVTPERRRHAYVCAEFYPWHFLYLR